MHILKILLNFGKALSYESYGIRFIRLAVMGQHSVLKDNQIKNIIRRIL
jgi:hypothetical protein